MAWSDLPQELLELSFKTLTDFFDVLRSQLVCHSWQSAAMIFYPNPVTTPLLLIPNKETMILSDVSELSKVYRVDSFSQTRCVSSYRGWLLLEAIDNPCKVYLLNPLLNKQVSLPKMPDNKGSVKLLTSTDPNNPNCYVFIFYSTNELLHKGFVSKVGDNEWREFFSSKHFYEDIIFYQRELYAINTDGEIDRLKFQDCPSIEIVPTRPICKRSSPCRYLVKSVHGELLMVMREVGTDSNPHGSLETKSIEVFKLDWDEGVWKNVDCFGGQEALLLAHNDSKFVRGKGYKGNCIYFVDDLWEEDKNSNCKDYGVYDLGSHKISRFNLLPEISNKALIYRWFKPTI